MLDFTGINWLAVLVAGIVSMAIGFVWYGALFGNLWMRLMNKRPEDMQSEAAGPAMYLVTFIAWLVLALVLALVINAVGVFTPLSGLVTGLVLAAGLAAATYIFASFSGPRLAVWALYVGYVAISMAVMGLILGWWR